MRPAAVGAPAEAIGSLGSSRSRFQFDWMGANGIAGLGLLGAMTVNSSSRRAIGYGVAPIHWSSENEGAFVSAATPPSAESEITLCVQY